MAKAYLKIDVEAGKEKEVRDVLLKIKGVKAADLTAGDQDIIAVIEARTTDAVMKLVVQELRRINGIEKTITNLVLEP